MRIGRWQNQYGSTLHITDEADGTIKGTFETSLGDNLNDCLHFAFSRSGPAGDTIASFTGLLRDGRLETLWHVVSDSAVKSPQPGRAPELMKLPWAHAALTNADTFQRVDD